MRWLYGPPVLRRVQIACTVVLLVMIAESLVAPLTWAGCVNNGRQFMLDLNSATLSIERVRPASSGSPPPGWSAAQSTPRLTPRAWIAPGGRFGLDLPLWLPLALILLPSLAARALLRRSQPGHCVRCGYDLRPLPPTPSVLCPECGHKNLRRPASTPTSPT